MNLTANTEMIASILILMFSAVLLVYWFRYSCVLLLKNAAERAEAPLADERFSIGYVLERVRTEKHLDTLERALDRDYHMLTYLLKHAADLELASIENRLLILDYRLMRLWYRITRTIAPEQSRKALTEMASVLGAVARQAGHQPQEA
jgi:hypothetical protein